MVGETRLRSRLLRTAMLCGLAVALVPAGARASDNAMGGDRGAASGPSAAATAVGFGTWHEMSWSGFAPQPVDSPEPPWTFTATGPALLKVTDWACSGDRFEVFDFGVSLGETPPVADQQECFGSADACYADPRFSSGTFLLGPGEHSITVTLIRSALQASGDPWGSGVGYFRVDEVPPCDAAPAGLVGCWHFDEQEGLTAFDSSGLGNDGTYLGGPVLGVPGVVNTAVSMDGSNDHVSVPDDASLDVGDSFTLDGWIQRDSFEKAQQLFFKGGKGFQLSVMSRFNGSQVYLRKAGVTTMYRTVGGVPEDDQFHHVVATKDGSDVAIYIDGVAQELQVVSPRTIEDTAFPLTFSSNGASAVAGDLDEFAVYDRALTPAEVEERFARGGLRATFSRSSSKAAKAGKARQEPQGEAVASRDAADGVGVFAVRRRSASRTPGSPPSMRPACRVWWRGRSRSRARGPSARRASRATWSTRTGRARSASARAAPARPARG